MTRVVFWGNVPSPYMVDRFNAVAARWNVEFEAWFSARTESDRSWIVDESRWHFPHRYLPRRSRYIRARAADATSIQPTPDLFVSFYAGADFLARQAPLSARPPGLAPRDVGAGPTLAPQHGELSGHSGDSRWPLTPGDKIQTWRPL